MIIRLVSRISERITFIEDRRRAGSYIFHYFIVRKRVCGREDTRVEVMSQLTRKISQREADVFLPGFPNLLQSSHNPLQLISSSSASEDHSIASFR
jgi:hypothetical protein